MTVKPVELQHSDLDLHWLTWRRTCAHFQLLQQHHNHLISLLYSFLSLTIVAQLELVITLSDRQIGNSLPRVLEQLKRLEDRRVPRLKAKNSHCVMLVESRVGDLSRPSYFLSETFQRRRTLGPAHVVMLTWCKRYIFHKDFIVHSSRIAWYWCSFPRHRLGRQTFGVESSLEFLSVTNRTKRWDHCVSCILAKVLINYCLVSRNSLNLKYLSS